MKSVNVIVNEMWRNIKKRCKKGGRYYKKGIELKLTELEFKTWAKKAVANFLSTNLDKPSVDRIDPDKSYEFGNVRIVPLWKNLTRTRYFCRCLGVSKELNSGRNMQKIAYLLVFMLDMLNIPVDMFVDYFQKNKETLESAIASDKTSI